LWLRGWGSNPRPTD